MHHSLNVNICAFSSYTKSSKSPENISKTINSSKKYIRSKIVGLKKMYLIGDKRLILGWICKVI